MCNQARTFAGLGLVKASGQCDPGKTVHSRYRIGVPGWAPISKACLVWLGIALPEINVTCLSAFIPVKVPETRSAEFARNPWRY